MRRAFVILWPRYLRPVSVPLAAYGAWGGSYACCWGFACCCDHWCGSLETAVGWPPVELQQRVFQNLQQQARDELPGEQIEALTSELSQIMEIERAMIANGMTPLKARKIALAGGIQSLANHLALNRMLPG